MMSIRIEKLKINRGGPLKQDFEFEPGDLNLIYGRNETGKSYLVEAMISLLFKSGKKSPVDWNLRPWSMAGNIRVSGIENAPVSFTKASPKLEDYWPDMGGVSQDFSRLLVVKEGEVFLFDQGDTGRSFLKNYLSGEGLLDDIQADIPATIRSASVSDGRISGNQTGDLKRQRELLEKRKRFEGLLEQAQTQYASGELRNLERRKQAIQEKFEALNKALRHHACNINEEIKTAEGEKARLPGSEQLSELGNLISVYESKTTELDARQAEVEKLKNNVEKYNWLRKAREIYTQASEKTASGPGLILFAAVLASIVGAGVSGFAGFIPGLIAGIIIAIVLLVVYYMQQQKALGTAGESRELENIKHEFRKHFGYELSNRATIESVYEQLGKEAARSENLANDIQSSLLPYLREHESRINSSLKTFTGRVVLKEDWAQEIRNLRQELEEKTRRIYELKADMSSLGVSPHQYVAENPGAEWDPLLYNDLEEQLRSVERDMEQEKADLETLRRQISREINCDSDDFGELFGRLQERHENTAEEYLVLTAEILAGIEVNKVIEELRQQENERIAEGLASQDLLEPLRMITGCYENMYYDAESGLMLVNKEGEDYPLGMLSTGAREQVFLAMRMGFAQIAMKGRRGFLLLDDAFQHSDWGRRTNLVNQVTALTATGWQVFYFTMDDHVKKLFEEAGNNLGKGFKYAEL